MKKTRMVVTSEGVRARDWEHPSDGSILKLSQEPSPLPRTMVAYWSEALGNGAECRRNPGGGVGTPAVILAAVGLIIALLVYISAR